MPRIPTCFKQLVAAYVIGWSVTAEDMPEDGGNAPASYVRPAMTVLPYAIANNLPYKVAAPVPFLAQNPPQLATYASDYFFTGGTFTNRNILLGWKSAHILSP